MVADSFKKSIKIMLEFKEFLLFGSYVWFWILAGLLFLCIIASEEQEEGGIAFIGVVIFLIFNYIWGNWILKIDLRVILIYVAIGLVYALLRSILLGYSEQKRYEQAFNKTYFTRKRVKDHVFRWWTIWPVSFLYWFFGKGLKSLFNSVYKIIGNMFENMFNVGWKGPKEDD